MKAYLLDMGILLTTNDEEFEQYADVYDKKYGYYDEDQHYEQHQSAAIETAQKYVEEGVERTYAVVLETELNDNFDFKDGCVENTSYLIENVIYSTAKIHGERIENFLGNKAGRNYVSDVEK